MTSNGVAAPSDYAEEPLEQPESEPTPESEAPKLSSTSLDYWREMTQRQIERLQARVDEIEAEAKPLRQQIQALTIALSATTPEFRGPRAKASGLNLTEQEKQLVASLVAQGKSTEEIRAHLPHVKPSMMYNVIYAARNKQQRETLR